jgi:hypothetical protein
MGRTGDKRQELYLNAAYGDPKSLRFSIFADVEYVEYDASHRYTNGASCGPPGVGCDATMGSSPGAYYNWTDSNENRNWAIGIGADWVYSARLKFSTSAMLERDDGSANFTSTVPQTNNTLPIASYGTSEKEVFNLKGIFAYDKHFEFTGGYAFELQRMSDIAYQGFTNVITVSGSAPNQNYLTGAYANPNYTLNILYLTGKYKF